MSKSPMAVHEAVELARDGKINATQFIERTREDWRRVALQIMRRWEVPIWFGVEDLEQELALSAWRAIASYEVSRGGMTIGAFVMWSAFAAGKRAIHKARLGKRPHRGESIARSQHEHLAADLFSSWDEPPPDAIDAITSEEPTQEIEASRASTVRLLMSRARNTVELYALRALAATGGKSIDDAAALLYDDETARLKCRLVSEEHAEREVARAVEHVALYVTA